MIIFLDTNILFNNWHLTNANFQYLFNFLENTNSDLYISDIVCQEVDNKFNSELELLRKSFRDNLKKSKILLLSSPNFNFEELDFNYSVKNLLSGKTSKVIFFPYDTITNQTLVERAIKKTRPFQSEDKGFRDTLIWLSFLDRLKSTEYKSKIAFINNNSSDFYNADKTSFHDDLKTDIAEHGIESEFSVFESIKDFINQEVDLEKHKFTRDQILEKYIEPNESALEELIETYFNSQSANWFSSLIKQYSTFYNNIYYLISYKFHIVEGIEDLEIISWSKIDEKSFFAEAILYLRIVDFEFTIPKPIYLSHKETLDKNYYDIELSGDYATLFGSRKVFLNISFNFEFSTSSFRDLAVNEFM